MSDFPFSDDDAWDEEQWEQYLKENDRRTDRYMQLMDRFIHEYPRPEDPAAIDAWKAEVRAFIESKGWTRDDIVLPFLWLEEDDADEPEEEQQTWIDETSAAADEADPDDRVDFRHLPVYHQAFEAVTVVLDWADTIEGEDKNSTLVHFCAHLMQVPAKIARGSAYGYERDTIGGNIACLKRSLREANEALDLLRLMKTEAYMDATTYRHLYEQVYEVRNGVALYVQELRERFDLGID